MIDEGKRSKFIKRKRKKEKEEQEEEEEEREAFSSLSADK